jgi:hypothetical protein
VVALGIAIAVIAVMNSDKGSLNAHTTASNPMMPAGNATPGTPAATTTPGSGSPATTPAPGNAGRANPATTPDNAPNTPTATAPPATITLTFELDPTTAAIALDGTPVTGPELVVPKDGAKHTLSFTAPGFLPHTEQLAFDESQRLVVSLKRAAGKPTPGRPPVKSTKPDRIDTESPYTP